MNNYDNELTRYVKFVGGAQAAADIFGCSQDMVSKMRADRRGISKKYVQLMYHTKGFKLSFKKLFEVD